MSFPALYAVCVLIWGTTWYAITFQLTGATPEVGTALRFSLAAVVLIAWCVWRRVAFTFPWRVHVWLALLGSTLRCLPASGPRAPLTSTVVALFVSAIFEAYDWRWATVLSIALAIFGNMLALNMKQEVPSAKPVV